MISLLYTSYSLIPDEQADRAVQEIIDASVASNKLNGLTGALIFTGVNFCQFLEGPENAVLRLMESIRRDSRHRDIWVVHQEAASERRFANWSMAYNGRSNFVSNYVLDIINSSVEAERENAAKSVINIMEEFAV